MRQSIKCCRGKRVKRSGYQMYSDSKLMLYMFGAELQKRLRSTSSSTDVFSAHPGVAQTDAFRKSDKSKFMARVLKSGADFIGQSPGGAAQSIMKCATDPSLTGENTFASQQRNRHLTDTRGAEVHHFFVNELCYEVNSNYAMSCRNGRWGQALGQLVHWHTSQAFWINLAAVLYS